MPFRRAGLRSRTPSDPRFLTARSLRVCWPVCGRESGRGDTRALACAAYTRQLLSLAAAPGTAPALRDNLLALLVDKMIEIDVRGVAWYVGCL